MSGKGKKGAPQDNGGQPSPWTEAAAALWQHNNEAYFLTISEVMNGPVTQSLKAPSEIESTPEDVLPDLLII